MLKNTKKIFFFFQKDSIEDETCKRKIMQRAEQAVTRAEELKFPKPVETVAGSPDVEIPEQSVEEPQKKSKHNQGYTAEEKQVLLSTSKINGINYVPFMDIDLKERYGKITSRNSLNFFRTSFQYNIPFTDKDGMLALAPKQKERFSGWARPEELFPDPKMIRDSCPYYQSIRQEVKFFQKMAGFWILLPRLF